MEGSLTLWLPDVWPLQKHRHPWGRTYREGKLARWVLSPKKASLKLFNEFFKRKSHDLTGLLLFILSEGNGNVSLTLFSVRWFFMSTVVKTLVCTFSNYTYFFILRKSSRGGRVAK